MSMLRFYKYFSYIYNMNKLYAFLFTLLTAIACTPTTVPVISNIVPAESLTINKSSNSDLSEERLKLFDNFVQSEMAANKIPGSVVLIKHKGKVAYSKTYGTKSIEDDTPMRKDELFYIQSMTKPIVSVAFMMLYEEGYFALDEPLSKYLPEFAEMKVATAHDKPSEGLVDAEPITIKHLMTHTAGFSHGLGASELDKKYLEALYLTEHKNIESRAKILATMPLVAQPGERWYYSAAPDIMSALIEQFTGMTCAEFLQKRIFDPLDMNDTGYNIKSGAEDRKSYLHATKPDGTMDVNPRQTPATGHTIFGGTHGLYSTAADYMKFCEMILNDGKANGKTFLGRKTLEIMNQNHLPEGQYSDVGKGFGLGFGVYLSPVQSGLPVSAGTIDWAGAYNTYFFIDPKEELIAVWMMQFAPYTNFYSLKLRQFVGSALD